MIAIHYRENSFSDKWIEYCQINSIEYKVVDCYSTDIINELNGCIALMWHWNQNDHKAQLFARQLIASVEKKGMKVFPNINTCWHYDDKLGQKYLLEAIDAPLINSYVFFDQNTALSWIEKNDFPKVFKLRSGAGAQNVKLIKSREEAESYAKKAFSKGFGVDRFGALEERIWHYKRDRSLKSFLNISRGLGRVLFPNKIKSSLPIEKNYLYLQDFIPDNDSDIRVVTIGKRAYGFKRMVRKEDFRASGSGETIYDPDAVPKECIKLAFETSKKLQTQCAAYDFVFLEGKPLIVEISYAFGKGHLNCTGYWDDKLNWIKGSFFPEYFMVEDLLC